MSIMTGKRIWAILMLAVCGQITPVLDNARLGPAACHATMASRRLSQPDADTTVVAVRQVKKGEELKAPDVPPPITAAADLCLVKLLVGPGATAEKDKNARSYSEGIGIEVWLPTHANWNERIRNYGGGGWVGGGHRYADKIGSKVPAIVNANMGYASGTTDAGQPWYQDGSFAFLSNGKVNAEVAARLLGARDGRAGRQDQGAGQPVLRQGAQIHLLRRPFAGRPAGHEDRPGISGALRRLYDRAAGAEHREVRDISAVSADRDEDRARLHGGEQGRSQSLCREGRRRQRARRRRLRHGRARLPARSLCLQLRSRARCRRRCAPAWPATA